MTATPVTYAQIWQEMADELRPHVRALWARYESSAMPFYIEPELVAEECDLLSYELKALEHGAAL